MIKYIINTTFLPVAGCSELSGRVFELEKK
jgi:hypothetical protein